LSDGRKKEIYQYIRFFHGALHVIVISAEYVDTTDMHVLIVVTHLIVVTLVQLIVDVYAG